MREFRLVAALFDMKRSGAPPNDGAELEHLYIANLWLPDLICSLTGEKSLMLYTGYINDLLDEA